MASSSKNRDTGGAVCLHLNHVTEGRRQDRRFFSGNTSEIVLYFCPECAQRWSAGEPVSWHVVSAKVSLY